MTFIKRGKNPYREAHSLFFRKKYHEQGVQASRRNIPFLMSYYEWYQLWRESDQLYNRGFHRGQYVMARIGDKGPYRLGNVKIITCSENSKEVWKNSGYKIKKSMTRPKSEATKHKMKVAGLARWKRWRENNGCA